MAIEGTDLTLKFGAKGKVPVYVAPKKNLKTVFCKVYDLMLETEESGTKIEKVKILIRKGIAET